DAHTVLVAERNGRLRMIRDNILLPEPVLYAIFVMDPKLVKWEKETEQEGVRLRADFTRAEIQRLANAAIPPRIFRWVRPLKAWYTCSCGDWLSGSRRILCSLHAV